MSHSGCSLFAICPSTTHSFSDRKRQQEVGQCASLWNSFSITYLYFIHIKNLFRENPESSTNVYKLWFWKKKQKQYSTWARVPDLLISFTRPPGKVDEALHADTAHFRTPSTCNKGPSGMLPASLSEARVSGQSGLQGSQAVGSGSGATRPPSQPWPGCLVLALWAPVDSKLSTGGEDMTMVDLSPESTPPSSPLLFPGLSWKRGHSVVLLNFGCLFTVLCSLLKLHVSANRVSWII